LNLKSPKLWYVIEIIAAICEFVAFIIYFLTVAELLGIKNYDTEALVKAYSGMLILIFCGIMLFSLVMAGIMGKQAESKKCLSGCHC